MKSRFVAALAVSLLVAGCGSGSTGSHASGATSTAVKITGTIPGATLAGRMDAAVRRSRTARFAINSTGPGAVAATGILRVPPVTGTATGSTATGSTAPPTWLWLAGRVPGGTVEVVALPDALYVRPPQPVSGRRWLKLARTGSAGITAGVSGGTTTDYRQMADSLLTSADLGAAAGVYAKVASFGIAGSRQIGSVLATRYVARLTATQVLAMVPESLQAAWASRLAGGTEDVEIDLDPSGLPLRLSSTLTSGSTTTVVYTAWGKPVTITPPPAEQVAEAP